MTAPGDAVTVVRYGAVTLQFTLEGGLFHAPLPPVILDGAGPALAEGLLVPAGAAFIPSAAAPAAAAAAAAANVPSAASTDMCAPSPAALTRPPPLVLHAHIHNPSPDDIRSFRLSIVQRVVLGGGSSSAMAASCEETEIFSLTDSDPVRRQATASSLRRWELPLSQQLPADGGRRAIPLPSVALGQWGVEVTHAVDVQVWIGASRSPCCARLPLWLDPPTAGPLAAALPLAPRRPHAAAVHLPALAGGLRQGPGSIQRVDSLP